MIIYNRQQKAHPADFDKIWHGLQSHHAFLAGMIRAELLGVHPRPELCPLAQQSKQAFGTH
ncbi:hypothetical protein KIN20_008965 [Parelaphostrongylus tenuis]|uniref:Uncharacterized protein n=1 Tax=Parelaphostrongylus tenuis TaxID=148309 RepID=A0AAD5MRW5_PARTN|nr:hypothetical protein KIN20_008965 [Parelaphostrongylus tenuis]